MLRITLHLGKPAEASALNVLGRLDIGVDKLAARADYSGVMRMRGIGVLPPATVTKYPRWSASVWDLVARMTCMCLNRHEKVWPETMAEAPGGAFVDDMTALVEEQTCDGETAIRVMVGTAHISMHSRCRYVATFEDSITGAVSGPMFAHSPKVLSPWDLLTRAYAWCTTGAFVLPPRPRLALPKESELDDQSVIPIDSLREPARTGITAWLVRHRKAPETHPSISGPCVSAAQLVDFMNGLPKPTRAQTGPTSGSSPTTTNPHRPGSGTPRGPPAASRRAGRARGACSSWQRGAIWTAFAIWPPCAGAAIATSSVRTATAAPPTTGRRPSCAGSASIAAVDSASPPRRCSQTDACRCGRSCWLCTCGLPVLRECLRCNCSG